MATVTRQIKSKMKPASAVGITILCDEENGTFGAGNFACLVQSESFCLLYDTGCEPETIFENLQKLELSLPNIDAVVISNTQNLSDYDLSPLLQNSHDTKIYLPASSPDKVVAGLSQHGCHVIKVSSPMKIFGEIYTLGELSGYYYVQDVIVRTPNGLILIGESGPPGIEKLCHETRILFPEEAIFMVLGNLRNAHSSDLNIFLTVDTFKRLKVQKVAPCRCSGEITRKYFGEGYQNDFVDVTTGQFIKI